jgi:chemotaxis signal transduction protein
LSIEQGNPGQGAAAAGVTSPARRARAALRVELGDAVYGIALDRLDHLVGFCALAGEPDDYFRGWLRFRGRHIPVFDLNRILCDQPTPEVFGSRILIVPGVKRPGGIGLLAPRATDTAILGDLEDSGVSLQELDLDSYLSMLEAMIPTEEPAL